MNCGSVRWGLLLPHCTDETQGGKAPAPQHAAGGRIAELRFKPRQPSLPAHLPCLRVSFLRVRVICSVHWDGVPYSGSVSVFGVNSYSALNTHTPSSCFTPAHIEQLLLCREGGLGGLRSTGCSRRDPGWTAQPGCWPLLSVKGGFQPSES